jgi:hypothetical protein
MTLMYASCLFLLFCAIHIFMYVNYYPILRYKFGMNYYMLNLPIPLNRLSEFKQPNLS